PVDQTRDAKHRKGKPAKEHQQMENPSQLFTRFDVSKVEVARLPEIGDQKEKAEEFGYFRDFQNRQPIELKLIGKGVYSGHPVEVLLIGSHANEEGTQ